MENKAIDRDRLLALLPARMRHPGGTAGRSLYAMRHHLRNGRDLGRDEQLPLLGILEVCEERILNAKAYSEAFLAAIGVSRTSPMGPKNEGFTT
jgi:hypothetical protein